MTRYVRLSFLILTLALAAPLLAQAAEDASYVIHPGDLLNVSVWGEEQLNREVTVLPGGTIDYPLIGSVQAAGQTTAGLQSALQEKLQPLIPAAAVTVLVKEPRGNVVSVLGQVTRPGDIIMNRPINVMQALSQAGGLSTYADGDAIRILRMEKGKQRAIAFDYERVAAGKGLESNIDLRAGDVIVVPTASLF